MTNRSDPKGDLRKTAFAQRRIAFGDPGIVARATRHLLSTIGAAHDMVISGYMPIRTEIDPLPAMTALAERNRICVPVIEGPGLPLKFREWRPDAPMVEGPFKAMIPASGDWLVPDILIVPLVAFDSSCNRLGYGGGFYDRTLERLRAQSDPRALGFAFDAQRLSSLPLEATDQPLDAIVTEARVYRP